jgi:fucose 4-O-acetylase-like acetyltransferase
MGTVFHSTNKQRIVWIDYYKFIGIFLIVLSHASFLNPEVIHFIFLFHVPIFFFISGYLEKVSPCSSKEYFIKIFHNLIIPYLIWNAISIIFHPSVGSVVSTLVGFSRTNGASWFIMVLVFLKINTLFYKNKQYILGAITTLLFILLHYYGNYMRMPYLINLSFMFSPFFFAGMYGKQIINTLDTKLSRHCVFLKIALAVVSFVLLYILYIYSPIPHTIAVVSFISQFYLYWLSGFLGIIGMFFFCICFTNQRHYIVIISNSTLFIMCSHYEIFRIITPIISNNYGDSITFCFVCVFFALQCLCSPLVLKYAPMLAGRK